MKKMKRLLALLLAAAMVFALAGCGETNVEETEAPEFVYKAEVRTLDAPSEQMRYFYPEVVTEDGFYTFVSEVVGQRELMEGEVLEYDGQLDIY